MTSTATSFVNVFMAGAPAGNVPQLDEDGGGGSFFSTKTKI
jgi:hypothetical protein